MKLLVAIAAALCLFFILCRALTYLEPKSPTDPAAPQVSILFTDSQGFTVKRFHDGGRDHYYVTGPADATTATVHQNGKTSRIETIPTKN